MSVQPPRNDGPAMPTAGSVSEPIAGTAPECSVCSVWRRPEGDWRSNSFEDDCFGVAGFPLDSADSDELDVRVPSAVTELNDAQVLNQQWVLDSARWPLWTRATRSTRSMAPPGRCSRLKARSDAQCGFAR
jgi:hypothetical protein